jgi:hypothetical protein
MAGTITAATLDSGASSTAPLFTANGTQIGTLCRAWVNYKGTATRAINASYNVSSVTVNGTGDYTINFTNALADVNYSVTGSVGTSTGGAGYRWLAAGSAAASNFSMLTTSVRVQTVYDTTNKSDADVVSVAVFR